MILLDTNVISEPLRPSPEARVSDWIDAQPLETLYLSAMTVAELRAGVALMPTGKRLCRADGEGSQGRHRHRDCRCLHRSSRLCQRIYRCYTRHKPFPSCRLGRYQPLGGRIRPGAPHKGQGQNHRSPDRKVTRACRGSSEARSPRSTAASHSCRQKFDLLPPSLRGQNASGNSSSGLLAAEKPCDKGTYGFPCHPEYLGSHGK